MMGAGLAVATVNGLISSPLYDPVAFLIRPFVGPWLANGMALPYTVTVFLAGLTWLMAGVPAAVYERVGRRGLSTWVSLAIWLVAAIALATPGLLGLAGYFSID